jgi:hypothetical protein
MSLPCVLGTTLQTLPARVPYLFADPDRVGRWRQELRAVTGLRVGINWQGNPTFGWDRFRSVPLTEFEPLGRVKGVRLISLQKGAGAEQLPALGGRFPALALDPDRDGAGGPFTDTAAILTQLDLVVTTDTAVAHLAGAMGVPVWVVLSAAADWRWLLGRDDYPWYPSMRLFRQRTPGDWAEVFGRIAAALLSFARPESRSG